VSKFFFYFSHQFEHFGLKRLIATCYKNQQRDLFSRHDSERAIYLEYLGDQDGNRRPDLHEITVHPLQGDGDFRSPECIELLKQADIVVTNPPFSLFREYVAQLVEYDKKFLIIGNMNAVTYKEIFPLFKENRMWLGVCPRGMEFVQPNGELNNVNAVWFTNLPHSKRNEELILWKKYSPEEYPHYDNYDAIEVSKVANIPENWGGHMGVPITFLDKYNPEQFEIIKFRKGDDNKDLRLKTEDFARLKGLGILPKRSKSLYFRILIRNKQV